MKGECVRMFRSASLPQLSAQGCTKGSPRRGWVTGLVVHETALTPLPSPLATSTLLSGEPTSWLTDSWTLPYSPHFSVIRLNRSYRASYLRGFQNLPDSYPLEKSFLKELAISFPLSLSLSFLLLSLSLCSSPCETYALASVAGKSSQSNFPRRGSTRETETAIEREGEWKKTRTEVRLGASERGKENA